MDIWQPEEDINWRKEDTWLGDQRYSGDRPLDYPLVAASNKVMNLDRFDLEQPRAVARR